MADYKLDIFDVIAKTDKGARNLWSELSDEQKKGYSGLIIMRWMCGTSDQRQIISMNEFVNPYVFSLGKHQELLHRLMCASSSKISRRYYWLSAKSKKSAAKKKTLEVIQEFYSVSEREAKTYLPLATVENITELAEKLGYQKDDLAQIKKEFK